MTNFDDEYTNRAIGILDFCQQKVTTPPMIPTIYHIKFPQSQKEEEQGQEHKHKNTKAPLRWGGGANLDIWIFPWTVKFIGKMDTL